MKSKPALKFYWLVYVKQKKVPVVTPILHDYFPLSFTVQLAWWKNSFIEGWLIHETNSCQNTRNLSFKQFLIDFADSISTACQNNKSKRGKPVDLYGFSLNSHDSKNLWD